MKFNGRICELDYSDAILTVNEYSCGRVIEACITSYEVDATF